MLENILGDCRSNAVCLVCLARRFFFSRGRGNSCLLLSWSPSWPLIPGLASAVVKTDTSAWNVRMAGLEPEKGMNEWVVHLAIARSRRFRVKLIEPFNHFGGCSGES